MIGGGIGTGGIENNQFLVGGFVRLGSSGVALVGEVFWLAKT